MADFFDENSVRLVIDATHPYAEFVTENIKKACKVEYIRVVREDVQADGTYFENIEAAAEYLEKTTGNNTYNDRFKGNCKVFGCFGQSVCTRIAVGGIAGVV